MCLASAVRAEAGHVAGFPVGLPFPLVSLRMLKHPRNCRNPVPGIPLYSTKRGHNGNPLPELIQPIHVDRIWEGAGQWGGRESCGRDGNFGCVEVKEQHVKHVSYLIVHTPNLFCLRFCNCVCLPKVLSQLRLAGGGTVVPEEFDTGNLLPSLPSVMCGLRKKILLPASFLCKCPKRFRGLCPSKSGRRTPTKRPAYCQF